jgi:hypothetical protein
VWQELLHQRGGLSKPVQRSLSTKKCATLITEKLKFSELGMAAMSIIPALRRLEQEYYEFKAWSI